MQVQGSIPSPLALERARLLVVQPASRSEYLRFVADALALVAPDTNRTLLVGPDRVDGPVDWIRCEGNQVTVSMAPSTNLAKLGNVVPDELVHLVRRTHALDELYDPSAWPSSDLGRTCRHDAAYRQGFSILLHEGGTLFGIAIVTAREADRVLSEVVLDALEGFAATLVTGLRAHLALVDYQREAAALRCIAGASATLLVIDRDARRVVWGANRARGLEWARDVLPEEDAVVNAAEALLAARAKGEKLVTPPRLRLGHPVAVAKFERGEFMGLARACSIRIEPVGNAEQHSALEGLSKREREMARLLVAGYSGVNIAAIVGLSENTVRTYFRRLYAKLDVSNRADLVRKLVSPDSDDPISPSTTIPAATAGGTDELLDD
jgi:DNA-binding CsgD family transcriptional regulator